MKFVPFVNSDNIKARELLVNLLESSPQGQTLGEMRKRLAVLKKLWAAQDDGVFLENAEHETLVNILNSRSDFAVTSEDIINVVDAVFGAKDQT